MALPTVDDLLRARADDRHPGLRFEGSSMSWDEVVRAGVERAALALARRRPGPFHIGVLLENVPEYLFWLGGAALAGATIVGINPTRRGAELARDVVHTDCQLVVTDQIGLEVIEPLGLDLGRDQILVIDDPSYQAELASCRDAPMPEARPSPDSLLLLVFTSGSTGAPKAVRCTTGRLGAIGTRAAPLYGFRREDVCYCSMPLFHGNALMALWAPALFTGATVAIRRKFSASGFLPDVRRFGATFFNYVGKSLAYILATPELPDDADNPLERGFGTEASERDIETFQRRFGCRIVEGYGMSEGGANIVRVPDMPKGALGRPQNDATFILDPKSGDECPRARFDGHGRLLNGDRAIGEIVNKSGAAGFEGYYRNDEANAERTRSGWYWTGDLGYRDEGGFFYFAGRGTDWLRVDSENFAAAPIERILFRLPEVVMAAVYAVPDPQAGDQVMAALELRPGAVFDPDGFAAFLGAQDDLGTKWAPRFVRITGAMPLTGSNKLIKKPLQEARWESADPVWWRPDRELSYRLLTEGDAAAIRKAFADHGRLDLLTS
jgi:steroid-22-oyl-CoA synthetase